MKRGEIWSFVGHGYGSKPRPGIIIQRDVTGPTPSVTVIPITRTESETGWVRASIDLPGETGTIRSFAMVDKIVTVRRSHFGARIGEITLKEMRSIERIVLGHLGFGSRLPKKSR